MGQILYAEDRDILVRIAQGDTAAFDTFYERYWKFVFNAAFKRLGNVEASKDISQEVFSQLWLRLQSEPAPVVDDLRAYLYVAVRNHVFKWMERERRFVPVSDVLVMLERQGDATDAGLLFEELLIAYRQVIERLPHQQRLIFQLRYDEGMSSSQIADHLRLSEKTVRNQLGRAVSKMKARIVCWLIFLAAIA
jgi:RNA polymerase sigma factor (sigma-70 family)